MVMMLDSSSCPEEEKLMFKRVNLLKQTFIHHNNHDCFISTNFGLKCERSKRTFLYLSIINSHLFTDSAPFA